MDTFYLVCLLLGGTLLACQFLLGLLGLGGHHDTDAGHDVHDVGGHDGHDHAPPHDDPGAGWFLSLLTFRSLTAALTLFGVVGLTATVNAKLEPLPALLLATGAGVAALALVAYLMKGLYQLRADGTVRIRHAVGHTGTVYVTVPGQKSGLGKVTLSLQNRTVECQALTPYDPLPTGAKVVVTAVVGSDTVEVAPAP